MNLPNAEFTQRLKRNSNVRYACRARIHHCHVFYGM